MLKTLQNQGQLVSQCTIVRHTITFHGDNNRKNHTNNEPALCLHLGKTAMAHSSRLGKRMMLLPFYSQLCRYLASIPRKKVGLQLCAQPARRACSTHFRCALFRLLQATLKMAKRGSVAKLASILRMYIPAGKASPSPPLGPALGQVRALERNIYLPNYVI